MAGINLKYVATLVDDARLQDSNAFASLFAITYKEQHQLAYSYLWDPSLVQDAMIDIYRNALHSIDRLDRSRDFIRWLNDMNIEICEALADAKDIKPPEGKPSIPEISLVEAERLLEYTFIREKREPNAIPLPTLIEYNEYRMQTYALQRLLVFAIIIGFIVAPMFSMTPSFSIEQDEEAAKTGQLKYIFTVDSYIPIDVCTARIDKDDTPVYQEGKRNYYLLPTKNGQMSVTVRFFSGRETTETISVTGVDRSVPKLLSSSIDGQYVHLFVTDTGSGIKWDSVYATDMGSNVIKPTSKDTKKGEVVFEYPTTFLNVYIPDKTGNVLHAVINHK